MKRIRKSVLPLALGLALVSGGLPAGSVRAAEASGFPDLPGSHFASTAVSTLSQLGYIAADRDGLFHPDRKITRGEAASLLLKYMKAPESIARTGFRDVGANHPYAGAIYALKDLGIMKGDGEEFHPDAEITREELASVLVRVFKWTDNGVQVWFKDSEAISPDHKEDVARLKQQLVTGQDTFMPSDSVTRAELAVFLYRAADLDTKTPGQIPLEDFFRQPAQVSFSMSPDGKYMAYMQPADNRMNVFVKKIGEKDAVQVTHATERDIMGYMWKGNDRLVYMTDKGGDENYHLYSVKLDGKDDKDLTPFPNTRAMLLDDLKEVKDEMLVLLNKRDPRFFDVYRLNVQTGELKLTAENPGNITGWMTDHQGRIRIASSSDGNNTAILYRQSEDQPFAPLLNTGYQDTFSPITFDADNKELFVATNLNRDKIQIVRYDPETKQVKETVFEHPDVDASNLIYSVQKKQVLAAVYETDKVHYQYFDDSYKSLMQTLESKAEGKTVSLQSMSEDGNLVMYRTYSDRSLGAYYSYDRKADKVEKIADVAPWLDESKLAEMKPITYKSRDGLTIHGYLTLPKGKDPKNLPVIVNPHGGPWARDSWGFNPEAQFLASRGYAVLQMNFRGSTGYGKEFMFLGNKQWGKNMQNDISDGVQWLIQEGIADPNRVAIYGASYGGYATLAGLTFTPELYAAGVDYVGPSSLFTLLNSLPPYWESEKQKMYEMVGDPVKDKALLEDISPLFHADRIEDPLFVAQGANDPRVNKAESDQMVQALRSRGVDVPYMVKANEGHGFANTENQLDFYRMLEKFLARHLKP
ncbi:S9 family peptidase [Gorillibacterium sp. sgz5001074]|uniref:S9 family peptidase n=1 Tax=Gorillibacterium sp. sgz5001074 TaxID=3446695 RepID=UPI003F67E309